MADQRPTKKKIHVYLSRCNTALRDIRTLMSQGKQYHRTLEGPQQFRDLMANAVEELTGCAGEAENLLTEYYHLEHDSPVPPAS